jgi:hypothetical protein
VLSKIVNKAEKYSWIGDKPIKFIASNTN